MQTTVFDGGSIRALAARFKIKSLRIQYSGFRLTANLSKAFDSFGELAEFLAGIQGRPFKSMMENTKDNIGDDKPFSLKDLEDAVKLFRNP